MGGGGYEGRALGEGVLKIKIIFLRRKGMKGERGEGEREGKEERERKEKKWGKKGVRRVNAMMVHGALRLQALLPCRHRNE